MIVPLMNPFLLSLSVCFVATVVSAQVRVPTRPLDRRVKEIAALPAHIKAPADGLALIADYDHPEKAPVDGYTYFPVYFINRSAQDVVFYAQDSDLYLKLEYKDTEGRWQRAQPHQYSWCGNSYFVQPSVPPGHFMKIEGFRMEKGEEETVRFAFHDGNAKVCQPSNVGKARIDPDMVRMAKRDAMVFSEGDFEFVSAVALGTIVLENELDPTEDMREMAIHHLCSPKHDLAKAYDVLKKISTGSGRHADIASGLLRGLDNARKAREAEAK